jgi:hypothetical protein
MRLHFDYLPMHDKRRKVSEERSRILRDFLFSPSELVPSNLNLSRLKPLWLTLAGARCDQAFIDLFV